MYRFSRSILGVLGVTAAACGPFISRPEFGSRADTLTLGVPSGGRAPRPPNDLPTSRRTPVRPSSLTICRGAAGTSGYVAVDYVASTDCPKSDRKYNAIVFSEYTQLAIGAKLIICVGQAPPRGWETTSTDVAEMKQCPREPTDRSADPTVVEIVRVR